MTNPVIECLKARRSCRAFSDRMPSRELIEAVVERQLWTPTDCKTPEQTLYGSIFREINTKEHPRIVKSNVKGKFVIAD